MAMQNEVLTIGGAVKDVTFYTNKGRFMATPENLTAQRMLAFEYGAKVYVDDASVGFGGGAANTAICLGLLGIKTGTVCCVGADADGKEIVENLSKNNVSKSGVQISKNNVSGFSMILATDRRDAEHIAFVHHGAINDLEITPSVLTRNKSKWILLTSLNGKNWQRNLKTIFATAHRQNRMIMWNPGNIQLQAGRRILSAYLAQTDILILNKDEAIELVLSGMRLGRKNPRHLNRPMYLLNILQEWGPRLVIITDGKRGCWAYDGKKIYRQGIKRVKAIDTTGVGDAFAATFLAAHITGHDITRALRWGMVNTASVVTKTGAQVGLLSKKELLSKV